MTGRVVLGGENILTIVHEDGSIETLQDIWNNIMRGVYMTYEYGKDYETNGEKPDLPDGVLVIAQYNDGEWLSISPVMDWNWPEIKKFRIVDERYKAKPEDSNWHEREGLPKVGEKCLAKIDRHHVECTVIAYYDDLVWLLDHDYDRTPVREIKNCEFLPIKTKRDVLVEKANKVVPAYTNETADSARLYTIGELIDAGWRPIKKMAEEQFVDFTIVQTGLLPDEDTARKAYRAGCRFVDTGE